MLYPPMSELLKHIPSRYLLVNVVARRARQIAIEAESSGVALEDNSRGGQWRADCQPEGRVYQVTPFAPVRADMGSAHGGRIAPRNGVFQRGRCYL